MSSSRVTAIVIVALLHALLGYAFITGLAYNVVKQVARDLKTFDVTEEPPPPEEVPPPPPPEQVNEPPPVVTPPPIVRTAPPVSAPIIQTAPVAPPVIITPTAPPAPPPPPAPKKLEAAKAKGNLLSLLSDEDYPSSALRNEEQGTTGVRLEIGANGRVTGCSVTSSSGSPTLDDTTCKLLSRRARFTPAKDDTGAATSDTYNQRVTWRLPQD